MDKKRFELGLAQRKATLGTEYVEKNLAAADEFTRPFQEAMTEWCWGFGWGDDAIDPKTRSLMNLSMIGALGWLIVAPTLLGVFLGRWLDSKLGTGVTFSGALTFAGACFGFFLAWHRMNEK